MRIVPYLYLPGKSEEAMKFYADIFDGEILMIQKYTDGPPDMDIPEGMEDKVMHGRIRFHGCMLYFSDAHGENEKSGHSLTLEFDDQEMLDNAYSKMKEGAQVHFELQDTFWGARYGKLTDKYGINWDLNYSYPKD